MALPNCNQATWPSCNDWLHYLSTQPASFVWTYAMPALIIAGLAAAAAKPRRGRDGRHKGNVVLFLVLIATGAVVFVTASLISTNTINF